MEIFRALAVFAEPPGRPEVARLAELLDLGEPPSLSEYTETFVFQLYPYASVYLGAEGMLGGEARDRVAGFLSALGLAPPHEPDHLSTLLATYAQLSAPEEDEGGTDEDESGADETKLRAYEDERGTNEVERRTNEDERGARRRAGRGAARRAFLWEHILSWLPAYLDKLAEIAPPFYRRWAKLLMSALVEEARASVPPVALPLHLREAPHVSDPRATSPDEFLRSLLAPARSGVILVRADLARAARSLGTALRAGERMFALKSLMGQDACGALAWLAEEAARVAALHVARRDALGGGAGWGAARACATERLLREVESHARNPRAATRPGGGEATARGRGEGEA